MPQRCALSSSNAPCLASAYTAVIQTQSMQQRWVVCIVDARGFESRWRPVQLCSTALLSLSIHPSTLAAGQRD